MGECLILIHSETVYMLVPVFIPQAGQILSSAIQAHRKHGRQWAPLLTPQTDLEFLVVLLLEKPASWLFCKKQSGMIVARESVLYFWESASKSFCLPCHSFSYHQGQVSVVSVQQRGNIIHWWLIWGTNTEKGPACLLWTQKLSVWCWEDRQVLSGCQGKQAGQSIMANDL